MHGFTLAWVRRTRWAFLYAAFALPLTVFSQPASRGIDTLRVASFNLAWAGTAQQFRQTARLCSRPTVQWCDARGKSPQARACQEAFTHAADRAAAASRPAPCNAYVDRYPVAHAPTLKDYRAKQHNLGRVIHERLQPDVIAFQEVSGRAAVLEILGPQASDYFVCAAHHKGFQTLAFAWRRALGGSETSCHAAPALAVPEDPDAFARGHFTYLMRPGLALRLTLAGEPVSFLNVHLKAGCANRYGTGRGRGRYKGALLTTPASENEACPTLLRQVAPLEAWIDATARATPRFVVLGDFNRKLHEELDLRGEPVREDGSRPAAPHTRPPTTRLLWPEIADGDPPAAALHLVFSEPPPRGCRSGNSGLDHIVLSRPLADLGANRGLRLHQIDPRAPGLPLRASRIEASDHCALLLRLDLR